MTLEEIKKMKADLGEKIKALVNDFEARAKTKIDDHIILRRPEAMGLPQTVELVETSITIE